MKRMILTFAAIAIILNTGLVCAEEIQITVKAGKHAYNNAPVCVPMSLPAELAERTTVMLTDGDRQVIGQFTAPGLTTEKIKSSKDGLTRRDLHFILTLPAGESVTLKWDTKIEPKRRLPSRFIWGQDKGGYQQLLFATTASDGLQPVLRYMKAPYDDSSPDARNKTYKIFHHMYDPTGKRFVTNGGQADPTIKGKLLFPHHRGLMYGFNRITYDGNKKCDSWHCRGDDYVEHVKTLSTEAGPVVGRHRVLVNWHGSAKDVFAVEEREVTVYNIPEKTNGWLVEFASRLKTTGGKVILDGDPQHAGFQFRAHNDVATKTKKQTYYLRPDGKGKPGETRNYDHKKKVGPVDLPWKAMSFVLDGQRYTVAYLDHPDNPGEARHSERDYGRFGYYFEYTLTKENPLLVDYRIWLQRGEMTLPEVATLQREFVSPPTVAVK